MRPDYVRQASKSCVRIMSGKHRSLASGLCPASIEVLRPDYVRQASKSCVRITSGKHRNLASGFVPATFKVRVPSRHGLRLGLSRQRSKSGFRPGTGCAWVCPGNVQSPGSVPARVAPGFVPATFKVRVPSRHGLRLGLSRQRSKSGSVPARFAPVPGKVRRPASPQQAKKSCVWVTSRRGRFASREQGMYSGAAPVAK